MIKNDIFKQITQSMSFPDINSRSIESKGTTNIPTNKNVIDFTNFENKANTLNLTITRIKDKDDTESKPVDFKTLKIFGSVDKKNKNIADLLIDVLKDSIFDGDPGGDGEPIDDDSKEKLLYIFPNSINESAA